MPRFTLSERSTVAIGVTLLALIIIILAAVIVASEKHISASKSKPITTSTVVANNPKTLEECLDKAALNYSNYIKLHGTITVNPDGTQAYIMTNENWQQAKNHLDSSRQQCYDSGQPTMLN
jgi:uncharacterized protein (UPF0333 family)